MVDFEYSLFIVNLKNAYFVEHQKRVIIMVIVAKH